jgi:hypothetical protein
VVLRLFVTPQNTFFHHFSVKAPIFQLYSFNKIDSFDLNQQLFFAFYLQVDLTCKFIVAFSHRGSKFFCLKQNGPPGLGWEQVLKEYTFLYKNPNNFGHLVSFFLNRTTER